MTFRMTVLDMTSMVFGLEIRGKTHRFILDCVNLALSQNTGRGTAQRSEWWHLDENEL